MDIEEVAKEDPNAIKVFPIDFAKGMREEDAAKIADTL
jgi:succinyl-CoA synthetase beta subunit